jgi:hypothetical protein
MTPNRNTEALSLIAMTQLALENSAVLIQATSGGKTGFSGELLTWLDMAEGHLQELRQHLAKERKAA